MGQKTEDHEKKTHKSRYYNLGTLSKSFEQLDKRAKCNKIKCMYYNPNKERCCSASRHSQCFLSHLPGDVNKTSDSDEKIPEVDDEFSLSICRCRIPISGKFPKFFLWLLFQQNDDYEQGAFQLDCDTYDPNKYANVALTTLRNKLPPCLRGFCKKEGRKYRVSASEVSHDEVSGTSQQCADSMADSMAHSRREESGNNTAGPRKGKFEDLTGDYYCYYYRPIRDMNGEYPVLYALLRISSDDGKLSARLILGLSEQSESQGEWSFDDIPATYSAFSEKREKCKANSVYYAEGSVDRIGQHGAVIHLKNTDNGSEWHIYLNLTNYSVCVRSRNKDADLYRGGLGCVMSVHESRGVHMWLMGLIRSSCKAEGILSETDDLKTYLNLEPVIQDGKDLEIKDRDQSFYEWFINL